MKMFGVQQKCINATCEKTKKECNECALNHQLSERRVHVHIPVLREISRKIHLFFLMHDII